MSTIISGVEVEDVLLSGFINGLNLSNFEIDFINVVDNRGEDPKIATVFESAKPYSLVEDMALLQGSKILLTELYNASPYMTSTGNDSGVATITSHTVGAENSGAYTEVTGFIQNADGTLLHDTGRNRYLSLKVNSYYVQWDGSFNTIAVYIYDQNNNYLGGGSTNQNLDLILNNIDISNAEKIFIKMKCGDNNTGKNGYWITLRVDYIRFFNRL